MPSDTTAPGASGERSWRPATRCIHAGYRADATSKAVVPPIVRSSTFLMDDEAYALRAAGRGGEAITYSRESNPSQIVVEERLAALDGAEAGLVFASGLAALNSVLVAFLEPGQRLVRARGLYGGSTSLINGLVPRLGVEVVQADFGDAKDLARACAGGAAMLFCEGVANPSMAVADLPAAAALAAEHGARLVVDETFATPMAQRPLEHGAAIALHSATKYLGGHSDLVAGATTGSRADMLDLQRWRTRLGGCLDPGAAYLLDRGLRTLHLRMRAHAENATRLAAWLAEHPEVERVLYPGHPSHPDHERAQRLLDLPGGMLAFVHRGGDAAALRFLRALRLVIEAPSLGGVESLVSLPANMSHVHLSPEERLAAGIPPGLVRMAVGVEDPDDLVADVEQALEASAG